MSGLIQINTTSDKKETLETISRTLVMRQLAACVQIGGPVESIYRWQGEIETSVEWTCSIKTKSILWPQIQQIIRQQHHYENPELIYTEIRDGSPEYLAWMQESLDNDK